MTADLTTYPPARRSDTEDVRHGERIADPYRWLEDPTSDETRQWAAAQERLFAAHRERWLGRPYFADRVAELTQTGTVGPPTWRGEQAFFVRRDADAEHAVLLTRGHDGAERVLVDPMALDPSGVTTLDAWQPSKDGRLLAYQASSGGTEESVLTVIDVDTTQVVDGPIDRCRYSPVAWLPDGSAFYYARQLPLAQVPDGDAQYHRRVWLHRLGSDPADDAMVFGADLDKTTFFGVRVSRDGRWLVVSASQGTAPRNDVWLADLSAGRLDAPELRPVIVGVDAQTHLWIARDGLLYAHTDRDAPRSRLLVGDPERPDPESWHELVPQDDTAVLEDVAILDGDGAEAALVCAWTRHAVAEISVHDLATGERRGAVPIPGLGSIGGLAERPEGGSEVWFACTDHLSPTTVYRHDIRDHSTQVWARSPGTVPDTAGMTARQVTYESLDGTPVHMFVVSRDDATGPRPTILYGYGGFGISLTPAYAASVLAWVEAGGTYAIANLRGGGEEGESWHRAGMREHKQAVFNDFHAAAEWLVDAHVTRPDQLAISGGSNGGLLVGAALTQRPDLYRAVVCSAPLLDMVRYEEHGLGRLWTDEYGTAAAAEQLQWLLAYSPYHKVQQGVAYPAVLFSVFASDTRVDPLHARKMCAALQAATEAPVDTHPVLLRAETDVGHGARAVSRTVAASADTLGFLAHATGLRIVDDLRKTG